MKAWPSRSSEALAQTGRECLSSAGENGREKEPGEQRKDDRGSSANRCDSVRPPTGSRRNEQFKDGGQLGRWVERNPSRARSLGEVLRAHVCHPIPHMGHGLVA